MKAVAEVTLALCAIQYADSLLCTIGGASPLRWALLNALVLTAVVAARVCVGGWELRDLGVKVTKLSREIAAGVLGFSLGRLLASPIDILTLDARFSAYGHSYLNYLSTAAPTSAVVTVAAALPEELFFRGYIQSLLTRSSSWALALIAAAIASSLGFSNRNLEFALAALPDLTVVGLTFAVTESLVSALVYRFLLAATLTAEVAAYVSLGRSLGFITIAVIFALSLVTLAALHRVVTEVFVLKLLKMDKPSKRELRDGVAIGLLLVAVALIARSLARGGLGC